MFQEIFLPSKPLGIHLCIRGFSWKFHTIYVLQNRASALRPISSNAGEREGCFFFRFVYPKLTDAERLVSTCSTVGIAWCIMTLLNSGALTRRCMLQYTESGYKYREIE